MSLPTVRRLHVMSLGNWTWQTNLSRVWLWRQPSGDFPFWPEQGIVFVYLTLSQAYVYSTCMKVSFARMHQPWTQSVIINKVSVLWWLCHKGSSIVGVDGLWLLMIDSGWQWLVMIDSGWQWLVMIDSGCNDWSWLTVVAMIGHDWQWLTMIGHDWLIGHNWQWLAMIDNDWPWLTVVDNDWPWLTMIGHDWQWLANQSVNHDPSIDA
jgi:hypothetical protein